MVDFVEREHKVRRMLKVAGTWHTHCGWCGEPTHNGDRYCCYGINSCASDALRAGRERDKKHTDW